MNITRIALFIILTSGLISSCAKLPTLTDTTYHEITTGKGPEDVVLDSMTMKKPRILISCNDHRLRDKAEEGNIYSYTIGTNATTASILPRKGEPDDIKFHPHGIFLSRNNENLPLLYVVSHIEKENRHPVLIYKVYEDSLVYLRKVENAAIYSPNSVTAMRDGGIYVTNDLGKRGRRIEAVLKQKKGSIVYCNAAGECKEVAGKLSYANGLLISPDEKKLFVSTTSQNYVFSYDVGAAGVLSNRETVMKIPGGDNLRWGPEPNQLIVAAHHNFLAFAKHAGNPSKKSPSVIYSIDLATKTKKTLYANKGEQISAASGAVLYGKTLFIAAVFQPHILQIPK